MISKFKYHIPVFALCLGIFIESSFPSDTYPSLEFEWSDKLIHFVIYFVLFFTFYYSFSHLEKFKFIFRFPFMMALIFTSVYGITDELHQYFVPGRTCDIFDWIADFLGAVFAMLILLLFKKYFILKKNRIKTVL